MMLGATPFSIYNTYTPEQIRVRRLRRRGEDLDLRAAVPAAGARGRKQLPSLDYVIVIDGEAPLGTLALADVEGSNPGFDVDAAVAQIKSTDVLTLIYTSGTTGPPKGVQLIHRNLLATVEGIEDLIEFPDDGRVISWLPAAHVAERNAHHYLPIVFGLQITCCDDPREVLSYLPEVRPSWFFAVPRIWEKLKAGLETMIAGQPEESARSCKQRSRRPNARFVSNRPGNPFRTRWPSRWSRPTPRSSLAGVRCSGSTRSRRSTSVRPQRRSRCSSSSTRSGCRSRSCGA